MASIAATTEEKVPFTIAPTSSAGTSVPTESFTVDLLGADLTYTYDEVTKTGFIESGATAGNFPFKFKLDTKIGPAEFFIEEDHDITISLPEATVISGTFSTAVPK